MKAITDATFQAEIARGGSVILFSADWCVPCKTVKPMLESIAKQFPKTKFVEIDVDKNPKAVGAYGISGVPTAVFFLDGAYKGTIASKFTERRMIEAIQQLLA